MFKNLYGPGVACMPQTPLVKCTFAIALSCILSAIL